MYGFSQTELLFFLARTRNNKLSTEKLGVTLVSTSGSGTPFQWCRVKPRAEFVDVAKLERSGSVGESIYIERCRN